MQRGTNHTAEAKQAISAKAKGKVKTAEHKAKLSASRKAAWAAKKANQLTEGE